MILDTTVLIDVMKGNTSAKEKISALSGKGEPITTTAISVFELFSGLSQSSKPLLEIEKIKSVLQNQVHWQLDKASAEKGGLINGELIKKGQQIDPEDAMIAGIALQHNESVLTRNLKHFSRIPGLKVETY